MKFIDYAKVELRSGTGGNGCCSFRREKFIPMGGPDGGDGGHGGKVILQGTTTKTTLMDFKFTQHFHAGNGVHGMGKNKHGRRGTDVVLHLPLGTVMRNAETGEVLADVVDEIPRLLFEGGRGGKGNARFRSSANQAPMETTDGLPGVELWVTLELKLMADVGLVGFPNAGKSTFISRVSKARPKIADYPFTTLVPNLGVVQNAAYESFVVADIPGIIRGAHEGHGLGHRFLRHIERTKMLLLLLDLASPEFQPWDEYSVLLDEMGLFSPDLLTKPRVVALTKMDMLADPDEIAGLKTKLEQAGERVFAISAVSGYGIDELLRFLGDAVKLHREKNTEKSGTEKSHGS